MLVCLPACVALIAAVDAYWLRPRPRVRGVGNRSRGCDTCARGDYGRDVHAPSFCGRNRFGIMTVEHQDMTDHELISALYEEVGVITYCGGDTSGDAETALAFVLFVTALPETRIHPDDIRDNTVATNPQWSALALEYVFSDRCETEHREIIIEFFATLTPAQRARAWRSVRAQAIGGSIAILDALAQRISIAT
jgi:hypothetical protein